MISSSTYKPLKANLLVGLIIGIASLYAPLINAAPIYKVVDEQTGRVTFTDNAQKYEQQGGKEISQTGITTESTHPISNSASNKSVNNTSAVPAQHTSQTSKAAQVNYQLTMIEPSEERAYRRPAQNIVVTVQLRPALQTGDTVNIYLDGNQVAQGLSASIATVDVLPGAHSVKAVVSNEKGLPIKQVERTVYVIQNTARLQNNKRIGKQLLAYQQLSWPQKVLLKMRQDGKQPNMQSFNTPQADKPMTLEQPALK
ncbi:DUF4124 domain-containing protein [Psychrobacter frigidicola]|uniref:DUF4124 domain-containing protein n=1 Tax=Psychrobacter frigidicola TaxID=45611 RepID=A0A5C7A3H8_9GAMM|nr:DUF4124 domain-containing protein [Psychrobacter frigidicola]TXD97969.1 DUF4124 domain-containing protein [Psychrobacter frigidicola]